MCMYIQQHQRVEISTYSLIKPKEFLYILRDIKQWAELYICMYILKHIHTVHLYLSMVNFSFCTKGVQLKLRKSFQVTGAKQKGAERLCHSATRSEGLDRSWSLQWLLAAGCWLCPGPAVSLPGLAVSASTLGSSLRLWLLQNPPPKPHQTPAQDTLAPTTWWLTGGSRGRVREGQQKPQSLNSGAALQGRPTVPAAPAICRCEIRAFVL